MTNRVRGIVQNSRKLKVSRPAVNLLTLDLNRGHDRLRTDSNLRAHPIISTRILFAKFISFLWVLYDLYAVLLFSHLYLTRLL